MKGRAPRDEVRNPKKAGASPVRTPQGGRVGRGDADRTGGNTPRRTRSPGARASGQGGREARGRRGREQHGRACGCARIDPTPVRERALEGRTSGGHRPRRDFSARAVRTLRGEQGSGVERRFVRLSGWRSTRTAREQARRREAYGSAGRNEALKTEPHERYRDETGPGGVAGWKPSRACETLWTEGGGPGRARDDRIRCSSCAVGEGSPGGRHPVRAIASESISG